MSDWLKRNYVDEFGPRVALAAAVGLTASGEYSLAHLVGFPGLIAALLPTAIDVYVIQAMRRHRDVLAALVLMVLTNALFHLANAGLFGVDHSGHATWWLIVLVSAIAPVIVWRVHRITEAASDDIPVVATGERAADVPAAETAAPAPAELSPTPPPVMPPVVAPEPTVAPASSAPVADSTPRQEAAPVAAEPAPVADRKPAPAPARKRTAGKRSSTRQAPRRSMTDWVDLAGPIFHAEFRRLRRQPTASEFATAIDAAGLGRVSESTAKNIRTEILDRTDVPALDQTD